MKLIPIQSIKFGSVAMIGGVQMGSVSVSDDVRKRDIKITYAVETGDYIIEKNGQATIVHRTNVQYALPTEIRSIDEYCAEAISSITETSMPESVIDADTQTARRRGRPRAEA